MSLSTRSALTLCLLSVAGSFASAAPITWAPVVEITSPSLISLEGELVEAINATRDDTAPVVAVGEELIAFTPRAFEVFNLSTDGIFTADGSDTGSAELNMVMNSFSIAPDWQFELTELETGFDYQIQFIGGGESRAMNFADRVGDGQFPENFSGDMRRASAESTIGTFIADGDTQTIHIQTGTAGGNGGAMSGYILRKLTLPPTPPTDIALSHDRIDPLSPAGTFIASLSATDVNIRDSHTFSLIEFNAFPGGALFDIQPGGLLFADSDLGPAGIEYLVKVRATDGDGLSYEESFVLRVLPTPPITSVSSSGGGLTFRAPVVPGRRMALQYSAELSSQSWLDLGNFIEVDGEMEFADPDDLRLSRPRGFYRNALRPLSP